MQIQCRPMKEITLRPALPDESPAPADPPTRAAEGAEPPEHVVTSATRSSVGRTWNLQSMGLEGRCLPPSGRPLPPNLDARKPRGPARRPGGPRCLAGHRRPAHPGVTAPPGRDASSAPSRDSPLAPTERSPPNGGLPSFHSCPAPPGPSHLASPGQPW